MNDLISIVLPVYNGAAYLRQSIDSVLAQTYPNWELLIVDDCSRDETAAISQAYADADPRIHYYRNEHNLRLPRNLNKGFSLAKGDYLTWTSDDNIFLPEALETMLRALKENPQAQFAFCDLDLIDETGAVVDGQYIPGNYADQVVGNNIVGACFLYTREVYNKIGDYQHGRLLVEDYDYWQRIFARYPVVPIHKVLYQYRRHAASLTGTNSQATVLHMVEETILCNLPLFGHLRVGQKYYLYEALHRCEKAQGREKYGLRFRFYWAFYYMPRRVWRKLKKGRKHD